jgi:hypothetical protein
MTNDLKIKLSIAAAVLLTLTVITAYLYHLGKEFYKFTYTQKYKELLKDIFITSLIILLVLSIYTIVNKNNKSQFIGGLILISIFIIFEIYVYILYKQSLNLRTIKNVKLVNQMSVKSYRGGNPTIYVYDENNTRYEVKINKSWFNDYFLINETSDNKENILLHNLVSSDMKQKNIYELKVYGYNFNDRHRFPIIYDYKIINE